MWWVAALSGLITILTLLQWLACWRLAGGVTVSGFLRECRRSRGNMQSLIFLTAIAALVFSPFGIAFDLMPPVLVPLEIPLALAAILSSTAPPSFLVLGPSIVQTASLCGGLSTGFPMLRAAAALDPMKLGALADYTLGPSGNIESDVRGMIASFKLAPVERG